jgi:hypothetical protein
MGLEGWVDTCRANLDALADAVKAKTEGDMT